MFPPNSVFRACLPVQVSPIIINTILTIQSVLTPAAETPQELDSPVAPKLCEKSDWKDLKMWFLEEGGDVDTKTEAPLVPQGESLKVGPQAHCFKAWRGLC